MHPADRYSLNLVRFIVAGALTLFLLFAVFTTARIAWDLAVKAVRPAPPTDAELMKKYGITTEKP